MNGAKKLLTKYTSSNFATKTQNFGWKDHDLQFHVISDNQVGVQCKQDPIVLNSSSDIL